MGDLDLTALEQRWPATRFEDVTDPDRDDRGERVLAWTPGPSVAEVAEALSCEDVTATDRLAATGRLGEVLVHLRAHAEPLEVAHVVAGALAQAESLEALHEEVLTGAGKAIGTASLRTGTQEEPTRTAEVLARLLLDEVDLVPGEPETLAGRLYWETRFEAERLLSAARALTQ